MEASCDGKILNQCMKESWLYRVEGGVEVVPEVDRLSIANMLDQLLGRSSKLAPIEPQQIQYSDDTKRVPREGWTGITRWLSLSKVFTLGRARRMSTGKLSSRRYLP